MYRSLSRWMFCIHKLIQNLRVVVVVIVVVVIVGRQRRTNAQRTMANWNLLIKRTSFEAEARIVTIPTNFIRGNVIEAKYNQTVLYIKREPKRTIFTLYRNERIVVGKFRVPYVKSWKMLLEMVFYTKENAQCMCCINASV